MISFKYKATFTVALSAFLILSCSKKPVNKVEVLLPKECAFKMISELNLQDSNKVEYVLFDMKTPLNNVFPGYLKIESTLNTKEHLIAVANRLTSDCLPEEMIEFSINVDGGVVGSAVSSVLTKPRNDLIIVFKKSNYKIIGKDMSNESL